MLCIDLGLRWDGETYGGSLLSSLAPSVGSTGEVMFKLSRRFVKSFAFVVAVPLSFLPGNAAQAQRARPSNPPAVAAPTVVGASGESVVRFYTGVVPRNHRIQAEVVSSPNPVTLSIFPGTIALSAALPGSTYVVRVRANQFYDAKTYAATNLNSAWVTANYTTPAQFEIPPAPSNLRVLNSGAGFTTLTWDAPPATASTPAGTYGYLVSVDGASPIPVCAGGAYNFCPPQTYTFATPPAGTSVQLRVLAINSPGNSSALSVPFVVNS
jgi:hypothetical protein